MSVLRRLVEGAWARSVVAEVARDPNPAPTHDYSRDSHSGAGNCHCGMPQRDRRHPHDFVGSANDRSKCTCGLKQSARCHLDTDHDPATCPDGHEELRGWKG